MDVGPDVGSGVKEARQIKFVFSQAVTNGSSRDAKPSQIHESWHDTHTFGVSYSVMKLTRLARGSWVLWQLLNRLKKYIFDKSC